MTFIKKIKRKIGKILFQPYGEILMLHSVVEKKSQLEANQVLEVTPAFLEQTILNYKSAGYKFVSLDQVQSMVERKKRHWRFLPKFVSFTLDDGFVDNYEQAYPVFKKYNCPFTIYVTTNYPDKKAQFWWIQLEKVLLKNENVTINGVEYDCSDLEKKNQAFLEIRKKIFSVDAEITMRALEQLFKDNDCSDMNSLALSWEQIIELAAEPLCTIGAHTVSHPALPTLSDEKIRKELSEGKKRIEEIIKKPVKHFAYPYGRFDERVVQLVMEQFSTAVTTKWGLINIGDSQHTLNRVNLEE